MKPKRRSGQGVVTRIPNGLSHPEARDPHAKLPTPARELPRLPGLPSLLTFAAGHLPGGIETAIHLAWLSRNPKVRTVARTWNRFRRPDRAGVWLEELCRAEGISTADFIGEIARTAWELRLDVTSLLTAPDEMIAIWEGILQQTELPDAAARRVQVIEYVQRHRAFVLGRDDL